MTHGISNDYQNYYCSWERNYNSSVVCPLAYFFTQTQLFWLQNPKWGGNFIPDGGIDPFSEMSRPKEIKFTLSVVHIFIFRTDS